MEELKKWALGVCAAAIFSSVIYALVPKGNMQKIMRCVTALAVICALVFPLASAIMKTNFFCILARHRGFDTERTK